jgi:hypothetical protein
MQKLEQDKWKLGIGHRRPRRTRMTSSFRGKDVSDRIVVA